MSQGISQSLSLLLQLPSPGIGKRLVMPLGSPPIFLSFFCHSNVRAMQSANSSSLWLWPNCSNPWKNLTFLSLRILVLCWSGFATLRYLQERIAKNIPTVAISPVACLSSVLFLHMSLLMTDMGIAFWCFSSGSEF
jgi:hypothetical protein